MSAPSPTTKGTHLAQPYPPSWFDRLLAGVDRLPGPAAAYYVVLWLVLLLVESALKWWDGTYPPGTFFLFHVWFAAVGPYALLVSHYLNAVASEALHACRPVLTVNEAEYTQLHYELTTAPPRPVRVATLLGLLFVLLWLPFPGNPTTPALAPLKLYTSPAALVLDTLIYSLHWALLGPAIYRVIYQLRVVQRILSAHLRINLFEPGPIYAFSHFTVLTAIFLLLGGYLWLATAPGALQRPTDLAFAVFLQLMAVLVFTWPLLGLHQRQVREKGRLLGEAGRRLEAMIGELHRRVDGCALATADQDGLNKAIDSLLKELSRLEKLPTWPWQPETPRLLATAIVVPVLIRFIPQVLESVLGR